MNKVYYLSHTDKSGMFGIPKSNPIYTAYNGFTALGFECIPFTEKAELDYICRDDIVVGGIGMVNYRLNKLGIEVPSIDYPEELKSYLGRNIWTDTLSNVQANFENKPIFIKPLIEKAFTGKVVSKFSDFIGVLSSEITQDSLLLCSDPIDIVSEYRVFMRYGYILDVRHYKGDWSVVPNKNVINNAIADYKSIPAGCSMDFGVTRDGKTILIEVNDGYALGDYGLLYTDYAKLISARWAELTNTIDILAYNG